MLTSGLRALRALGRLSVIKPTGPRVSLIMLLYAGAVHSPRRSREAPRLLTLDAIVDFVFLA